MKSIWDSAIGLLLATGTLLGLTLPFGKMASDAGITPLVWTFVISFGAGVVLLLVLLARGGESSVLGAHRLRYYVIAAAVSYVIPNILLFAAIPHLGAGYAGIMFTLTPIITLLFSIALGIRRPNALGMSGIMVGFVGAMLVATTRGEVGRPADWFWITMGLLFPLSLSIGNIYRTYDWPKDTSPTTLAAGSHLAAAIMLLIAIPASGATSSFASLGMVPLLTLAQAVSASLMYVLYFRLQAVGGPVYLSQISYVAAMVGLIAGTQVFGERYGVLTWCGAGVIMVGVLLTTLAQAQFKRNAP